MDIGGLDCVDGTVVLDIKPYVPFADSVDGAQAPRWVDRASKSISIFCIN